MGRSLKNLAPQQEQENAISATCEDLLRKTREDLLSEKIMFFI